MKKLNKKQQIALSVVMLIAGAVLISSTFIKSIGGGIKLSALCLGIGSPLFAMGSGRILYLLVMTDDEIKRSEKKKAVEVADERNMHLKEKTGLACYRIIFFALCAFCILVGFTSQGKVAVVGAAVLVISACILPVFVMSYYNKRI